MEVAENTTVESTDTIATEGAPEAAQTEGFTPAQTETPPETTAAKSYAATLKYKFLDQDKEFNPLFKDLVKTPEVEKVLKELHEKSDGLDFIKPKYHETREELKTVKSEFSNFQKEVQDLGQMIQKGDLDTFFSRIQLPAQKVYDWVLNKVKEQEMLAQLPPEQKMVYQRNLQNQQKASQLEGTLKETNDRVEQAEARARTFELDLGLSKPEVQSFAQNYDAAVGTPGAFRNEVIQAGLLAFHTTQQDIGVEQAIQQVMSKYGRFIQPQAGASATSQEAPMQDNPQVVRSRPTVIPNLQGKGSSSPVKKAIRSIDDLKEAAKRVNNLN